MAALLIGNSFGAYGLPMAYNRKRHTESANAPAAVPLPRTTRLQRPLDPAPEPFKSNCAHMAHPRQQADETCLAVSDSLHPVMEPITQNASRHIASWSYTTCMHGQFVGQNPTAL
jgi:hypothetical protein